jgi:hypothetical protein
MFPERQWVFIPFKEGWITHTCNILFQPDVITRNAQFVHEFISKRQKLVTAAMTIGPGLLVRLMASYYLPFLRYGTEDIGHRMDALTGAHNSTAVITDYPEIALDIDKASDVPVIEEFMRQRGT